MDYHSSLLLREAQAVGHVTSRKLVDAAVRLIEVRQDVDEATAYALLVQRSIEERRSVRATAITTLTELPSDPLS